MSNQNLEKAVNALISLPNGINLSYNESNNLLRTDGYTSSAGNTYFNGVRLSEKIVMTLNIGLGYAHTFINGISIYQMHGDKELIAKEDFTGTIYDENHIKQIATSLIFEKLKFNAIKDQIEIDDKSLQEFSEKLIQETYRNQIDTIMDVKFGKLLK